jgi:hypothetical protein
MKINLFVVFAITIFALSHGVSYANDITANGKQRRGQGVDGELSGEGFNIPAGQVGTITAAQGDCDGFWVEGKKVRVFKSALAGIGAVFSAGSYRVYPNLRDNQNEADIGITVRLASGGIGASGTGTGAGGSGATGVGAGGTGTGVAAGGKGTGSAGSDAVGFGGTWCLDSSRQECVVIKQEGESVKAELLHAGAKTVDLVGYQKGASIALSFRNTKGEIGAWMAISNAKGRMEAICLNPDGTLRWKATYIRSDAPTP